MWRVLASGTILVSAVACSAGPSGGGPAAAATPAATASNAAPSASGPIDVCGVVTREEAAAVLGPLPQQPPSKTDNAGFGTYMCMYLGPALSGEGAQTRFARLTVSAGRGKDAADIMEMKTEKMHATIDLPGVGDRAKRSSDGSFVWAQQGGVGCTAEIAVGLPPALTADSAAAQLGRLCGKVLAAGR